MYIYNMSNRPIILSLLCVVLFFSGKIIHAQNTVIQKYENTLIQPPYLKTGDTVAIVAPSGILKNRTQEIEKAKEYYKFLGNSANGTFQDVLNFIEFNTTVVKSDIK